MLRILKGGILIILLFTMKGVIGQNYYNAPYTRYLIGDIINSGFSYNKSLGGSSIALRPHNQLNYLNPASFTAQDTNSFLLQLGVNGRYANITTDLDSDNSFNMNIDYLAIGFPVTKWWNVSIGATPYSRIQYSFREESSGSSIGEEMIFDYNGSGGFNEFYMGNSFTISNVVSLGLNVSYLFGSLDRQQISYLPELTYYSASIENKSYSIASDFYFKAGFQYHPTINDKHSIIIGATYDFQSKIDVKRKSQTIRANTSSTVSGGGKISFDTLNFNDNELNPFTLPSKLAIGATYIYDESILVTAEYINQDWSGTEIVTSNFKAGLYESIRFGAEYTPVPLSNRIRVNYLKRMSYRIGGNFTKTYLYTVDNKNISDNSVSIGIGLPVKNARKIFTGTNINIGYQYGQRGTTENGLIKDKYHNFSIGITLHDFWFLKPKYD